MIITTGQRNDRFKMIFLVPFGYIEIGAEKYIGGYDEVSYENGRFIEFRREVL